MNWIQLWVRHKNGFTAKRAVTIEPYLMISGAFVPPPSQESLVSPNGNAEIRIMDSNELTVNIVKAALKGYGFVIEAEINNEPN